MKLKQKRVVNLAIAAASLVLVVAVFSALKSSQAVCEYFAARGVTRAISSVFGAINTLFPFSVMEFLVYALAVFIIVSVVFQIIHLKKHRRWEFLRNLTRVLVVILAIVAVYGATASLNYGREPLVTHIVRYESEVDDYNAKLTVKYYIEDFNRLAKEMERDENGITVVPYTQEELFQKLKAEYDKLDNDAYFSSFEYRPKRIAWSDLLSTFGILGVGFIPSGEANVNSNTVPCDLAHITAHEMAHLKGVMREDDAELLAAYICLNSDDVYLRYSGYCNNYGYILRLLLDRGLNGEYNDALRSLDPLISNELRARHDSYESKYNILSWIGNEINNLYLKMNGAENGTGSYTPQSKSTRELLYGIYFEEHSILEEPPPAEPEPARIIILPEGISRAIA